MVERVKGWLAEGHAVRIFTARMSAVDREERYAVFTAVGDWTLKHVGQRIEATCIKDYQMIECWDDRAVQVIPNTGVCIADELEAERTARAGKP